MEFDGTPLALVERCCRADDTRLEVVSRVKGFQPHGALENGGCRRPPPPGGRHMHDERSPKRGLRDRDDGGHSGRARDLGLTFMVGPPAVDSTVFPPQ